MELGSVLLPVFIQHTKLSYGIEGSLYQLSCQLPSLELELSVAFFYSFLNVYLWILTPSPKFLYFCANNNGFYVILFLCFGTSLPIFYLSHHSTFVTLIWNVLLVSLVPKSGTTILCFCESGVQQTCTFSLCEPPSDCALSCLGRAYGTRCSVLMLDGWFKSGLLSLVAHAIVFLWLQIFFSFLSISSDSEIPIIGMWWPALHFKCGSAYLFVQLYSFV